MLKAHHEAARPGPPGHPNAGHLALAGDVSGPGHRRQHGAILLREASYPPVIYFPKADVAMEHLAATSRSTHCPYKGDASYFSIAVGGETAENAVWAYETPYPAMAEIAGLVAFYPNIAQIAEVGA